jgi:signal transduction histidine kinase
VTGYSTLGLVVLALVGGSGVTALALVGLVWTRRDTPGATGFLAYLVAESVLCFGTVGIFLSSSAPVAEAFYYVASVAGIASGSIWVLFIVQYTGNWDRMRWWAHALVWGEPAVFALAFLTNPFHGRLIELEVTTYRSLTLVDPTETLLTQAQILYVLLLVAGSFVLLGRLFFQTRHVHRKQTGAILFGSLFVTAVYGLFRAGVTLHPALDLTPVLFIVQALIAGWALFRYDFLSVSPIATELFLEQMSDPLVVLDHQHRVVDCNDAARGALGLDPERKAALDAATPELAAALEEGADSVQFDGGTRVYDLTETSIHDQHDRYRGSLLVLRDVSERHQQRRTLQQQNEQLERFTSVVSHDLRNPLNAARGYAELALERDDEAALREAIDTMDEMEDLVEGLLTLAREGRTVDDPTRVNLAAVARAAWRGAPTEGATLEVGADADVDIYADPDRLRELFGNLYRNAMEHAAAGPESADGGDTDEEQYSVTVTVGRLTDCDGFYVADDGTGIPSEDRDKVFESGFTTESSGTGLGLAIVDSITTAHDWVVEVTEASDGGARFEFAGVRMEAL